MRTMRSLNIGFGLVNIPVKLYKATDSGSSTSLCNVHRDCGTAVKEPKYCPKCEKMLETGDLEKAFPLDRKKEHCMPISEAELSYLPLPSNKTVAVSGWIDKLPDIRYTDEYYVTAPDEGGERAYALFEAALRKSNKTWVAKVTIGSREHLCALVPTGTGAIYLETLHWAEEIRDLTELKIPEVKVSEKELAMADMLLGTLPEVNLAEFKNEYGEALKKLVADKQAGITVSGPVTPAPTKEVDLVEQLMASLKVAGAAK